VCEGRRPPDHALSVAAAADVALDPVQVFLNNRITDRYTVQRMGEGHELIHAGLEGPPLASPARNALSIARNRPLVIRQDYKEPTDAFVTDVFEQLSEIALFASIHRGLLLAFPGNARPFHVLAEISRASS